MIDVVVEEPDLMMLKTIECTILTKAMLAKDPVLCVCWPVVITTTKTFPHRLERFAETGASRPSPAYDRERRPGDRQGRLRREVQRKRYRIALYRLGRPENLKRGPQDRRREGSCRYRAATVSVDVGRMEAKKKWKGEFRWWRKQRGGM